LAQAGQGGENLRIHFATIRLTRDRVRRLKPHLARDQFVESPYLRVLAAEQRQKTRLGTRRPLGAAGAQCGDAMFQFGEVKRQVIYPQTSALADGRWLGRLQVSERQARQRSVPRRKSRQGIHHRRQPTADQRQPFAHQEQVGVVGDVTTCGAEMDDRSRLGTHIAVSVNVRHHIVPQLPLVAGRGVEVDIVNLRT
jgi:hypothetical protein